MALYLGIDIGTSASKGVLIDDRCNIVCQASCGHETENPCDGWYQHDAEAVWWGDFCRLSRELVARSGVNAAQIGCVGLSALGCDCVPVDTECNALAPAILYGVDARSKPQIDELLSEYGSDRARELFGHDPCSSDIAPKILWFKENMPEVHERAAKFLTASSFLCAKLTGRFTVDRYLAEDFLPLYDRFTWKVDARECARFCRPDQMAEVMSATDIAGVITQRAAEATGLAVGTPVLVGTGDSGAEAISTGVFRPGDMMVQLGSTAYFIYLADHMIDDARLWPGTFIIPGTYGICAGTNTAGALTSWLRQELYRDAVEAEGHGGPDAYSVMAHDAADVAPGADGLLCLPYFAGERTPLNDPEARGVFFGLTGRHTRAHMVRAALEGVAYTVASHVDIIERSMDCQLGALCLSEAEPRIQFGCRLSPTYAGARSRLPRLRWVHASVMPLWQLSQVAPTHHGMNSPKSLALRKQSSPIWLPTSYMRRAVISLTNCMHATVISCTNWCNAAELYCLPIGAALCGFACPLAFLPTGVSEGQKQSAHLLKLPTQCAVHRSF